MPVWFRSSFLMVISLYLVSATHVLAIPNPAALYAEKLGYEVRVVKTESGEKSQVVLPLGLVDAWDFFRGKVGGDYAYGARLGYQTYCKRLETNGYVQEYAVCIPTGLKTKTSGLTDGEIPLIDLMALHGEPLLDEPHRPVARPVVSADASPSSIVADVDSLPASFDWRNYNGHAYIGPPRDQGSCGSCYSFGACAAAEGVYNFATANYDANCINFSESFIAWCLGRLPAYSDNFFGCDGADYEYAELAALTNEGIILESAFPYVESDPSSCTHWGDPRIVFKSWGRTIPGDTDSIKEAIRTYGVVDAAILTDGGFDRYSTGIYENANTSCPDGYYTSADHAVALVGWDDNPPEGGGGVWILRNSWGSSWGENGYMRIRYFSGGVNCAVCYLAYNVARQAPVFSYAPMGTNQVGRVGVLMTVGITATEPNGDGITLSASSKPAGSSFTATSGSSPLSQSFTWTPSTTGIYQVVFVASDADGVTTSTMQIVVNGALAGGCEEVLQADFSAGLPSGWINVDDLAQTPSQAWEFNNPGGREFYASSAANGFAILDSDNYGNGESQRANLVTPLLDLSGYTSIVLRFEHSYNDYDTDDWCGLWCSTDGSLSNYTWLATWTADTANPAIYLSNVTAQVAGSSMVRFGWHYEGSWAWYWCVDDVSVMGCIADTSVMYPNVSTSDGFSLSSGSLVFRWDPIEGATYRVACSTNLIDDPFTRVVVSNLSVNAYTSPVGLVPLSLYRIEKE